MTASRLEGSERMSKTQRRLVAWIFYGGLGALLLVIVTGLLGMLMPAPVASRVAYNSEGYLFAVVLAAWIQFALPRLQASRRMTWSIGHGAVWLIIGIGLYMSDLPSRIKTLNEAALALAIVIPYVALRRPIPRWIPYSTVVLIALTVWAVGWAPDSWVIDQAETFGFVVLAMLTFDVFDKQLLDSSAQEPVKTRLAWYGFMLLEPIVVSALGVAIREDSDPLSLTLRYLGRIHESFVGMLLVALILYLLPAYRRRLVG